MKAVAFPVSPRIGTPPTTAVRRLGRRLRALVAALWRAACRHAERPQRVVPYY